MTDVYVADIKEEAKDNEDFRRVLFTSPRTQLVLMSLEPGQEIGMEVHDGDQVLYIVDGDGLAVLDGVEQEIEKGSIVLVPAGVRHNIVSGEEEPLKLFTLYAPPQHAPGVVQKTKPGAKAALDDEEAATELATIDTM